MPSEGRVRVFVSSTILDLRDVRSALKFWLEELGFEVLLSEFNDFDRRPDSGTFDACFEAIGTCDFYILLVGSRVGSSFTEGVTVTQQEFRVAKSLSDSGAITIVPFVRGEVMAALRLQSDMEAGRLLFQAKTDADGALAAEDVKKIRSFVNEVKHTGILAPAGGTGGKLWLYGFNVFEDIATALRIALHANRGVRRQILLANLAAEIESNIAEVVTNRNGVPFPTQWFLGQIRETLSLANDKLNQLIRIDARTVQRLLTFELFSGSVANLKTSPLEDAIQSGEFLVFDRVSNSFSDSAELMGMKALSKEIGRCRHVSTGLRQPPWPETTETLLQSSLAGLQHTAIPGAYVMFLFGLHDGIENVLRLECAIHQWIYGDSEDFIMPQLNSTAVDAASAEELKSETPTPELIRLWLQNAAVRDILTGLHSATPTDRVAALKEFPGWCDGPWGDYDRMWSDFLDLLPTFEKLKQIEGEEAAQRWLENEFRIKMRAHFDTRSDLPGADD